MSLFQIDLFALKGDGGERILFLGVSRLTGYLLRMVQSTPHSGRAGEAQASDFGQPSACCAGSIS
jgi:hypothetical protein